MIVYKSLCILLLGPGKWNYLGFFGLLLLLLMYLSFLIGTSQIILRVWSWNWEDHVQLVDYVSETADVSSWKFSNYSRLSQIPISHRFHSLLRPYMQSVNLLRIRGAPSWGSGFWIPFSEPSFWRISWNTSLESGFRQWEGNASWEAYLRRHLRYPRCSLTHSQIQLLGFGGWLLETNILVE